MKKRIKYFFIRIVEYPFLNSFKEEVLKKILPLKLGEEIISGYGLKYKYVGNKKFIICT